MVVTYIDYCLKTTFHHQQLYVETGKKTDKFKTIISGKKLKLIEEWKRGRS